MSHETTADHGHDEHHEHHVCSIQFMTTIFLALMCLTIITVAAIYIDLGSLNIWLAMGIAGIKALLVVFYFMHIRWDRGFHALCIFGSLGFLAMLIGYTKIDTAQYEANIGAKDADVEQIEYAK